MGSRPNKLPSSHAVPRGNLVFSAGHTIASPSRLITSSGLGPAVEWIRLHVPYLLINLDGVPLSQCERKRGFSPNARLTICVGWLGGTGHAQRHGIFGKGCGVR
jgi:hypothetical protein